MNWLRSTYVVPQEVKSTYSDNGNTREHPLLQANRLRQMELREYHVGWVCGGADHVYSPGAGHIGDVIFVYRQII